MTRNHQRILQLHSLLSKLLDSLCFELAITNPDENSLSLLEILLWRRKDDISDQELKQLYSGWLQARNVYDLFKAKQIASFPKAQLIAQQITQQNFINISQVTKSLEVLNMLYNQLYLDRRPNEKINLDQVETIFAYLDNQGLIHLRLSSIFHFCGVVLICQGHTIPQNYDIFKIHLQQFRKQMCQIDGMVSLRCFKNFLLAYSQRNVLFKSFLDVCQSINKLTYKGKKNQPANILQETLQKWKVFPRFSNGSIQSKNRIQIYKRLFQQNQHIFFDKHPDQALSYLIEKYGQEFISCFDIDSALIRQFTTILKETLNYYIEIFIKVSQRNNTSMQSISTIENNRSHQITRVKGSNYEVQPNQNLRLQKKNTQKQKTPLKPRAKKEDEFRNRTPTYHRQNLEIHRQFGSAQRINQTQGSARQYTPTKSTQTARHQRNISTSFMDTKQNKPKLLPENVTMHYQTSYYRNKRVQSYETVMRRFKKK